MKKFTFYLITLFLFTLVCLFRTPSFSQVSIVSTTGYSVNINIFAVSIAPTSNSCVNGYNYNVNLKYVITFTGTNIPASLYTLQGTLGCATASHFFDLPNNGGTGTVMSQSNQWSSVSDCATATVVSKNCNTVNIQIFGPGISSRIVSFTPSAAAVLDVKLLNFSAATDQNKVRINWSTASETGNDFFAVERSTDGSQWKEIKTVKGAGNSTTLINYQVYDESPVTGTAYYRLKQTDFDGKISYSAIESVKYAPVAGNISVYPVPNTGKTITIAGINDYKNFDLTLVNAGGAVLYKTNLTHASVELPSVQPGLYVIRVKNNLSGETMNMRYVKM